VSNETQGDDNSPSPVYNGYEVIPMTQQLILELPDDPYAAVQRTADFNAKTPSE
jgi:hypothetical protein